MDFSRFNFSCRIAIYEAISLAKRHSHQDVYPVHLALGLSRLGNLADEFAPEGTMERLKAMVAQLPKTFSASSPRYSPRLMMVFSQLAPVSDERTGQRAAEQLVTERQLFSQLTKICPELFARDEGRTAVGERSGQRRGDWRPYTPPNLGSQGGSQGKGSSKPGADLNKSTHDKPKNKTPLELYTTDLTLKAAEGEFDPIGHRDQEMWRLREVLGRKKKNNPILLGEPGVGKTAIVEGLAQKLIADDSTKRLLALDLGALLAGAKYRGDLEGRVQTLVAELAEHDGQVVLFIDEVHMLLGAGGKEGQGDLANYLKPALASGALQCIGATTYAEYQQIIEKDPALSRRFQPILVAEPTAAAALAILRGLKERYEDYHQIVISDDALVAAVSLSQRYLPLRQLPDKAIDLLDEACSLVKLQTAKEPREIATLRSTIEQMELEWAGAKGAAADADEFRPKAKAERQRQAVIVQVGLHKAKEELSYWLSVFTRYQNLCESRIGEGRRLAELRSQYDRAMEHQDFDLAAKLSHEEIPQQTDKVKALAKAIDRLERDHPSIAHTVSEGHVQQILHRWTGIPMATLKQQAATLRQAGAGDGLNVSGLGPFLKERLFGQPQAIAAVTKTLTRAALGLTRADQPLGVFLLVGATGLGKTYLAKLLATYLYGDSGRLIRFDMGEFQEPHTVARLLGSPPGYVGHESVGKLSQELRRYPFSVLLIDEIEKAHPQVLDVFLRLFDEGQITDSGGRQLDFTNGVVLMTSNALTLSAKRRENSASSEDQLRLSLRSVFRPEFVNRIDDVVVFEPLSPSTMLRLVAARLAAANEDLAGRQLRLELAPALAARMAEQAALSDDGARALERLFIRAVLDPLAERLASCPQLYVGWWLYDGTSWLPAYRPGTLLTAPELTPEPDSSP